MCRGVEESNNNNNNSSSHSHSHSHGGFCKLPIPKEAAPQRPSASSIVACAVISCELCSSRASLYCQADDAYLCRKCDQWVHGANFLAQRHVRCLLCNTCQRLTQRYLIGVSMEVLLPTLVSSKSPERSQCQSFDDATKCTRTLKRPFLFL